MTIVANRFSVPHFGFKAVKEDGGDPLPERDPKIELIAKFYDRQAELHTERDEEIQAQAARATASGLRAGIVDPRQADNHYEQGCNKQDADTFHRSTNH